MSARPLDLSLYLVTDTRLCGAVGVPATVAAAVAAGVTVVQLRDPQADDGELVTLGRALVAALAGTGVPLLVDDHVDLVAPIGADGAHVGQRDLPPEEARARLGCDAILGLSVRTVAEARAAGDLLPDTLDYLGVGPVWHQTTKTDARPTIGTDGLAAVTAATDLPCVAIGGVTRERVAAVRAAGAAGAAVVSAICGQPDPGAAARDLRAAWDAAVPAGAPA